MPEPLLRPLVLRGVTLPNNLVLSPMAGFSDVAFRVLARRHGAGLVCSEMVASSGVEREVPQTMLRMATVDEERPTSIQVFGTEPEEVARATRRVERDCDVVGFNMGCPAFQIKRQGCGAALLDRPDLAEELVRALRSATSKPVLVKMRAGNDAPIDVVRFARALERAGADGIILHARTARMGYSGRSDWQLIRRLKESLGVPVVGNGDVTDGPSAERALAASGADGLAVGRASLGDPRVFRRIARWLEAGERVAPPTPEERLADYREYVRMAEAVGISWEQVGQQGQQFTRGLAGGARLRTRLQGIHPPAHYLGEFEGHVASMRDGARVVAPAR